MTNSFSAYPWGRWIKWGAVGLLVFILLVSAISNYNGLVAAEQGMKTSWSQVENVMQRRLDTIPNMVEVAKQYAKHEEAIFKEISEATAILQNDTADLDSKIEADSRLNAALRNILVVVKNYPELKSNKQFEELQTVIEGSENRIAQERRNFIKSVEQYNNKVKRFPGSIFAGLMGFKEKDYYKASPEAQNAPKIDFND